MPQIEKNSVTALPFPSDALYPAFCAGTLEVHWGQILRVHLDALAILRASYPELSGLTVYELLTRRSLPRRDADEIRWHAGAIYAHELYFASLAPPCGGYPQPSRELSEVISRDIGSIPELAYRLGEAATAMRGVGFLYLLRDAFGRLSIRFLRDYDCPMLTRELPLFCIDLWEHAYFSDHGAHPERAVDAFLSVLCWSNVEKRFKNK